MTRRVMLVDDDPDLLSLFSRILERAGFAVLTAEDGYEALGMLEKATPDLMILDVMMPLIDGIELCRQVRARTQTAQTPVIMLSARGDAEAIEESFEAGADLYLNKPIVPRDLVAGARSVLSLRAGSEEDVAM